MANKLHTWCERLAAVQVTLFCLALAMVLVVCGTLAQVQIGTFTAQKEYFNSWWIYGWYGDARLPILPGGLTVGAFWMVNLLAAFVTRFKFQKKDAGILISHFGLIVLLLGQFLTQTLAHESQMPIEIGQTSNYSEAFRDTEIAVIDVSDPHFDQVTSIPYSIFSRRDRIPLVGTSLELAIRKLYKNAQLTMASTNPPHPAPSPTAGRGNSLNTPSPLGGEGGGGGYATQGIGTRIGIQELPPVSSDEEVNTVAAYVEVFNKGQSLGTWLISSGLGAPQSFNADGEDYRLYLRPRRFYYPFSVTLKDFRHDIYPGTDIPKNFSSLVHLSYPLRQESRDALIYMNHPLRYEGKTFYQASFGKGDRLSVFQVVQNPAWATPYISCFLVILGLSMEFLQHLWKFAERRR